MSWAETEAEAEHYRIPAAPRIGGALREASSDFYYNSWRLIPANLVWGAAIMVLLLLAAAWPVGAVLLAPLLALPTAGLFRMAALIARGDFVSFRDALGYRSFFRPAMVAGVVLTVTTVIPAVNIAVGLGSRDPVGLVMATMAFWWLVFQGMFTICFWPILLDPRRSDLSVLERTRLAVLLVVAFPFRFAVLAFVVAVLLVVGTIVFIALVTLDLALVALLACRYVLPAADRLEGRATELVVV